MGHAGKILKDLIVMSFAPKACNSKKAQNSENGMLEREHLVKTLNLTFASTLLSKF